MNHYLHKFQLDLITPGSLPRWPSIRCVTSHEKSLDWLPCLDKRRKPVYSKHKIACRREIRRKKKPSDIFIARKFMMIAVRLLLVFLAVDEFGHPLFKRGEK